MLTQIFSLQYFVHVAEFCALDTRAHVQTGLGYGKLLHGEAVAIGMHMAADMSHRMGWVDQELVDRSVVLMKKAGLPVELPKGGGMDMDKFLNVSGEGFCVDSGRCSVTVGFPSRGHILYTRVAFCWKYSLVALRG